MKINSVNSLQNAVAVEGTASTESCGVESTCYDASESGLDGVKKKKGAMPGAWRGLPESEIGRLISDMVCRLRQCNVSLDGETAESFFARAILDNPRVTNEQILAMRKASLAQMADSEREQRRVLKKYPDVRTYTVHKFCCALFGAALGLDPRELSCVAPSLGLTGAPTAPILFLARSSRMQANTALHDLTEHMRQRSHVHGLNKAVWGFEGRLASTLCVPLDRRKF